MTALWVLVGGGVLLANVDSLPAFAVGAVGWLILAAFMR